MSTEEGSAAVADATETTGTESDKTETSAQAEAGAESTAAKSTSESKDESVSASEAAKRPEGRDNAERRIKQLDHKVKELTKQLASIKPAEIKTKLTEPTKPKLEAFEDITQYEAAIDKYAKDMRQYGVESDRQEREVATQRSQTEALEKVAKEAWDNAETATVKRVPEYNRKEALATVEPSPTMDGFFVDSEIGPDVLWHLSENPDLADKIRELPPYRAVRELIAIEAKLSSQIKGIRKPNAAGKPGGYVSGTGGNQSKPKRAADILYG